MGPNYSETVQWNHSRIVGLENQAINQEKDVKVSKRRRQVALISMGLLAAVLISVIVLFVVL